MAFRNTPTRDVDLVNNVPVIYQLYFTAKYTREYSTIESLTNGFYDEFTYNIGPICYIRAFEHRDNYVYGYLKFWRHIDNNICLFRYSSVDFFTLRASECNTTTANHVYPDGLLLRFNKENKIKSTETKRHPWGHLLNAEQLRALKEKTSSAIFKNQPINSSTLTNECSIYDDQVNTSYKQIHQMNSTSANVSATTTAKAPIKPLLPNVSSVNDSVSSASSVSINDVSTTTISQNNTNSNNSTQQAKKSVSFNLPADQQDETKSKTCSKVNQPISIDLQALIAFCKTQANLNQEESSNNLLKGILSLKNDSPTDPMDDDYSLLDFIPPAANSTWN